MKTEHIIRKKIGKAIGDYNLINDKDRILVGISGGKDSWTLWHFLNILQRKAPVNYELIPFTLFTESTLEHKSEFEEVIEKRFNCRLESKYIPLNKIFEEKNQKDKIPCSLCSRLRRGYIYKAAEELGVNKIALGHHLDDFVETVLLNMFHNGILKGMGVKYMTDKKDFVVIRPMIYLKEKIIKNFIRTADYPLLDFCPIDKTKFKTRNRDEIKKLLKDLEKENKRIKYNILNSLTNVKKTHLLDKDLIDFTQIELEKVE